jgi:hypothetical protein
MKKFFYMAIIITVSRANAQRPETGGWLALQLPVNFSKHLQWHNDAGYRTLGTSVVPFQYLYRTGLRYHFNEQWSLAGGIAFFFSRTTFSKTNDEFGKEFRFWEEANHQQVITEKLQGQLRFRAEQRFFAATSLKVNYTTYRFRLRAGLTQKVNKKWSIQLADEYMQQQANQQFSFDQNRLILSGIYSLNQSLQLQGSYMWVAWPAEDQHILIISFIKNISLHGA